MWRPVRASGVHVGGFQRAILVSGCLFEQDLTLLPTPAVNDMGEGKTVDHWDEWTAKMQAAHGNGNGHGKSLAIEAQRLLPTPLRGGRGGHGRRAWERRARTRSRSTP